MLTITDLNAELAKLSMLRDRTPQMTSAEREESRAFSRLMSYRGGAIFISRFAGIGAWERHPNDDEIVQIIEGNDYTPSYQQPSFGDFHPERRDLSYYSPGSMASLRVSRRYQFNDCDPSAHGPHHRG